MGGPGLHPQAFSARGNPLASRIERVEVSRRRGNGDAPDWTVPGPSSRCAPSVTPPSDQPESPKSRRTAGGATRCRCPSAPTNGVRPPARTTPSAFPGDANTGRYGTRRCVRMQTVPRSPDGTMRSIAGRPCRLQNSFERPAPFRPAKRRLASDTRDGKPRAARARTASPCPLGMESLSPQSLQPALDCDGRFERGRMDV